jgi:hypothetical protein
MPVRSDEERFLELRVVGRAYERLLDERVLDDILHRPYETPSGAFVAFSTVIPL